MKRPLVSWTRTVEVWGSWREPALGERDGFERALEWENGFSIAPSPWNGREGPPLIVDAPIAIALSERGWLASAQWLVVSRECCL